MRTFSNPKGCGEKHTKMKTENLTKASHSLDFLLGELKESHTDAVNSGSRFEAALFDLMEEALRLQVKLETIKAAATRANAAKEKEQK